MKPLTLMLLMLLGLLLYMNWVSDGPENGGNGNDHG